MIVGGYSLHLYCDFPTPFKKKDTCGKFAESPGNPHTQWEAVQSLRKAGWMVNTARNVCYCPEHNYGKKMRDAAAANSPLARANKT